MWYHGCHNNVMTGVASLRPSMTCESTITAFSWLRFRVRADEKNRPPTRFWLAVWHLKGHWHQDWCQNVPSCSSAYECWLTGAIIHFLRAGTHLHQQTPCTVMLTDDESFFVIRSVLSEWLYLFSFLFFFFVGLSPVSWPSGLAPRSWCERTGRYRGTNCSRASSASCTI